MRKLLNQIIDLFFPLFSRWLSLSTYRYLAYGSINAGLGVVFYYLIYNYLLHQQDVICYGITVSSPVAAQIIESIIFCISGFLANKYLVFKESNLKGRVQLFRYVNMYVINFLLNIAIVNTLVRTFNFYPTLSKLIATITIAILSYFSSKNYSFRKATNPKIIKNNDEDNNG